MHSYYSQPFCASTCWMDELKLVTTAGKNSSCWCVSHRGHLCAWRTAYYVEGTNQGINWKGIEAWLELGIQGSRDTPHVFPFAWWLRSKCTECFTLLYQEEMALDPSPCVLLLPSKTWVQGWVITLLFLTQLVREEDIYIPMTVLYIPYSSLWI